MKNKVSKKPLSTIRLRLKISANFAVPAPILNSVLVFEITNADQLLLDVSHRFELNPQPHEQRSFLRRLRGTTDVSWKLGCYIDFCRLKSIEEEIGNLKISTDPAGPEQTVGKVQCLEKSG
jgi:hypothetical protein